MIVNDESQVEGPIGVGVVIAAYGDESAAKETLDRARQVRMDGLIDFEDAAIVRRDTGGHVHINESGDMSTGKGAGIGALIGGLIGVLGGPAGVALGAGAGAALGGVAAHSDAGFDNRSLDELGAALPEGSSAIVVTTSTAFIEAVRSESTDEETMATAQEISAIIRDHLAAEEDVLMAVVVTEDGVAARKVVASADELAVFGIDATEGAVDIRTAVADEDGVTYNEVAAVVDTVDTPDGAAVAKEEEPADDEQEEEAAPEA